MEVKKYFQNYKELVESDNYKELLRLVREKNFSAKDIPVTSRELNHWAIKDLLYENYEDSKWKKFSIVDILWIQTIRELRKFEVPLKTIKLAKEYLTVDFNISDIFIQDTDDIIQLFKNSVSTKYGSTTVFEDIDSALKEIKVKYEPHNLFEYYVIDSYLLKNPNKIMLNYEGIAVIYSDLYLPEFLNSNIYKYKFQNCNISISVNALISTVFKDYKFDDLASRWKLITDKEKKVLEILQAHKDVESVTIKFNENSEIDLVIPKEKLTVTHNNFFRKVFIEGDYSEMKIIKKNGEVVLFEREIRHRI